MQPDSVRCCKVTEEKRGTAAQGLYFRYTSQEIFKKSNICLVLFTVLWVHTDFSSPYDICSFMYLLHMLMCHVNK